MRAFYTPTVEEASRLGSGRPGGAGGGANVWELIKWIEEDASRQGPRLRMRPDGGCRVLHFLGEKMKTAMMSTCTFCMCRELDLMIFSGLSLYRYRGLFY
jgi:hypothetical protein